MRIQALCVALLVFVLAGCDKADEQKDFAARYTGTFIRTSNLPAFSPIISNVTLNLTETAFTGTSDVTHYPAICSGSFTITQFKIIAANTCFFTTQFDGTLIFDGEYNYEQKGNQLQIWRTYSNGTTDLYKLTKAE